MNPGGGSGWDESPLDIQIPDDARELDRDVLAYHRELRARRRRNRMRRLAGPFAGHGTIMPVLASILAVCLVAGAMLSVATFSPATAPAEQASRPATATPSAHPGPPHSTAAVRPSAASGTATGPSASGTATGPSGASSSGASRASRSASPAASAASAARPGPSEPGSSSPGAPR